MDLEAAVRDISRGDSAPTSLALRLLREESDRETARTLGTLFADPDDSLLETVADLLESLADPRAVEILLPLLRHETPRVRNAARALLERIAPAAPEPLLRFSHDPDPRMRIFAAGILGSVAAPAAGTRLLDLLQDPDPTVKDAAVVALGQLRLAAAVPALRSFIDGGHAWIRLSAVDALASIGGPEAAEALVAALRSADPTVPLAAIDALGRIGVPGAVGPLVTLMKDVPELRPAVLRSLTGPLAAAVRAGAGTTVAADLVLLAEEDLKAGLLKGRLADRTRELLRSLQEVRP